MPRSVHHTPTKQAGLVGWRERVFFLSYHRIKSWLVVKEQMPILSSLVN